MKALFARIGGFLLESINRGHQRSVKAKKHILASFGIKGTSILVGFLLVPLTIDYVNAEQYGIWLTLSSVVAWFSFFDIGLGHGLRNKLAEALAVGDLEEARIFVSSTYAILTIIFTIVLVFFFLIQPLVNWQAILNTTSLDAEQLRLVAIATFSFFCINFVLRLLYSIFLADQLPAYQGFYNLLGNALSLIVIFILTKITTGSLFNLALAVGLSPMIILIFASFYVFRGRYQHIAPSLHYVDRKYFRELMSLGGKFFLIKITTIVIFSSDNLIITQIFGPTEVPAYVIAHKFFSLITAAFAIISVPFWSAYTEAYIKKEMEWIISTNRNLIRLWMYLVGVSILMLLFSSAFYHVWVPEIQVPFLLSAMMCIYVNILAWGNIFVVFINGVGKVQLQLVVSLIATILNIPLSYLFAVPMGLGTAGVILASTICIGYGPVLAPIQFNRIVNGTAKGIWSR